MPAESLTTSARSAVGVEPEIAKIVTGPNNVAICSECVALAVEAINKPMPPKD